MLPELVRLLLVGTVMMAVVMTLFWLLHFPLRNAALVDIGWAAGLGLLALVYALLGSGEPAHRILIAALASVASFRLAAHLALRQFREGGEEGRYRQLRQEWKTRLGLKFFVFYQVQALLDVLLSIPFLLVCLNPRPGLSVLEWIGAAVWFLGFAGESAADAQLARFKRAPENKGQVCDTGLWRYSRHPNYFFQWLIWIGYFLIALDGPYGWTALFAPLLILYFLLRITGIPATEAQLLRSKGEAYRTYRASTSAFVPLPKRRGTTGKRNM